MALSSSRLPLSLSAPCRASSSGSLGVLAFVEEVGAELAERGDLAVVEGLLRSDHGVRVLLRVAERGGDLGALEDVAVDRERDLGGPDQEGDQYLDRGEVPPVGLRLEAVDDGLDRDLLAEALLADDEGQHLFRGRGELRHGVGVEQAAVGIRCRGDLLLAVGDAAEQLELGVGAADEVLEAIGNPGDRVLRGRRDVGGVDDQRGLADGAAHALDELLLPVGVLRALGAQDLVHGRGDRGALLAPDVLLGLDAAGGGPRAPGRPGRG